MGKTDEAAALQKTLVQRIEARTGKQDSQPGSEKSVGAGVASASAVTLSTGVAGVPEIKVHKQINSLRGKGPVTTGSIDIDKLPDAPIPEVQPEAEIPAPAATANGREDPVAWAQQVREREEAERRQADSARQQSTYKSREEALKAAIKAQADSKPATRKKK